MGQPHSIGRVAGGLFHPSGNYLADLKVVMMWYGMLLSTSLLLHWTHIWFDSHTAPAKYYANTPTESFVKHKCHACTYIIWNAWLYVKIPVQKIHVKPSKNVELVQTLRHTIPLCLVAHDLSTCCHNTSHCWNSLKIFSAAFRYHKLGGHNVPGIESSVRLHLRPLCMFWYPNTSQTFVRELTTQSLGLNATKVISCLAVACAACIRGRHADLCSSWRSCLLTSELFFMSLLDIAGHQCLFYQTKTFGKWSELPLLVVCWTYIAKKDWWVWGVLQMLFLNVPSGYLKWRHGSVIYICFFLWVLLSVGTWWQKYIFCLKPRFLTEKVLILGRISQHLWSRFTESVFLAIMDSWNVSLLNVAPTLGWYGKQEYVICHNFVWFIMFHLEFTGRMFTGKMNMLLAMLCSLGFWLFCFPQNSCWKTPLMCERFLHPNCFFYCSYLDPRKPSPVTILGVSLSLWHHASQGWLAVADSCPHCLAPLSEGRIKNSGVQLACSNYGCKFDYKDMFTVIPQVCHACWHLKKSKLAF